MIDAARLSQRRAAASSRRPPAPTPRGNPAAAAAAAARVRARSSPATSAPAPAAAATTASEDGLIFALGAPGAWDSGAVGNPVVRCYVSLPETAAAPPPRARGSGGAQAAGAAAPPPAAAAASVSTRWVMWYSGRPSGEAPLPAALAAACPGAGGSTGVAYSDDGVRWQRGGGDVAGGIGAAGRGDAGRALAPNGEEWWAHDTCHATVSDVQVMGGGGGGGGVYWMFYAGGDFEAVAAPAALAALGPPSAPAEAAAPSSPAAPPPGAAAADAAAAAAPVDADPPAAAAEGLRMRVGLAMSQDGRNFARIEGDHHTGAVLDAGRGNGAPSAPPLAASACPSWDALYVASPSVLISGPSGDMRMYYTSFDAARGRFAVGLATSKDGLKWDRRGDAGGGGGGGGSDSGGGSASGASATAAPVFEGTGQAWDAAGAASVQVVRDPDDPRGRYLLFYEAVASDGARSIGAVASADGVSGWAPLHAGGRPLLERAGAAAEDAAAGAGPAAGEGAGTAGAWDGGGVGAPCAVPMSGGRWRLYYAGRPAGGGDGSWRGVGLALGSLAEGGGEFRRRAGE